MVARSIRKRSEDSEAVPNVILPENEVAGTTSVAALEGCSTEKDHTHWIKKELTEDQILLVDDEAVKTDKKNTKAVITTTGSKKSSKVAAEVEDEAIVAEKKTSSRKQKYEKLQIEAEEIADPVSKNYKSKSKATENATKSRFTPKRRAEIVKLYIENSRSVVLTQRAYRRKYSVEHAPSDNTIRRLVSNFVKHGTVEDRQHAVHQRPTRSNELVEAVRKNVDENPYVSYRQRAQHFGISGTTMRRILKDDLHVLSESGRV